VLARRRHKGVLGERESAGAACMEPVTAAPRRVTSDAILRAALGGPTYLDLHGLAKLLFLAMTGATWSIPTSLHNVALLSFLSLLCTLRPEPAHNNPCTQRACLLFLHGAIPCVSSVQSPLVPNHKPYASAHAYRRQVDPPLHNLQALDQEEMYTSEIQSPDCLIHLHPKIPSEGNGSSAATTSPELS
jgi:hypothetical protein